MKALPIILIIIGAMLTLIVQAAPCTTPESNTHFSEDTMLCAGYHEVKNLYLETAGMSFDCGGATLEGELDKQAIIITANNVHLKNCNIITYKKAVSVDGSAVFENVQLSQNVIALYTVNSNVDSGGITFKDNERDIYNNIKDEPAQKKITKVIDNKVSKELLDVLAIQETVNDKVHIEKELTITEKKSTFSIIITPQEDVGELIMYEHIPKEIAGHVDEITFSQPVTVINEDPDVLLPIGRLKVKTSFKVDYSIKKKLTGKEEMPSTVIVEQDNEKAEDSTSEESVEETEEKINNKKKSQETEDDKDKSEGNSFWTIIFFIIAALTSTALFFFERHHA